MEHTEILQDITNACRLCLVNNCNIRSIFIKPDNEWVEGDISQHIFLCTNIQVTPHDGPTGICRSCLRQIVSIIQFRNRCQKIDNFLRSRYCGVYFNQPPAVGSSKNVEEIDILLTFINCGDEESLLKKVTSVEEETDDRISNCFDPFEDSFFDGDNDEDEDEKDIFGDDSFKLDETAGESNNSDDNDDMKNNLDLNESENSDNEELDSNDTDGNNDNKGENIRQRYKCRYKLKGAPRPKQYIEPWPKLKKRDLMETKAYRGLCHICGKVFQHLWVHLQSHSIVPTDTCDICGKGFKSKASLTLHVLTHKEAELPCEICGKKYRTKMRLKRHMRVHTGERPFMCEICRKCFYTKYNLSVHMRIHTGDKPFNCDYCQECFTHSYALKHHMERIHRTVSEIK